MPAEKVVANSPNPFVALEAAVKAVADRKAAAEAAREAYNKAEEAHQAAIKAAQEAYSKVSEQLAFVAPQGSASVRL